MRGTILILLLIYRATESCPFGWVDPASESMYKIYKIFDEMNEFLIETFNKQNVWLEKVTLF